MANEVNQNTDQIIDAKDVLEQSEVTEASAVTPGVIQRCGPTGDKGVAARL